MAGQDPAYARQVRQDGSTGVKIMKPQKIDKGAYERNLTFFLVFAFLALFLFMQFLQ